MELKREWKYIDGFPNYQVSNYAEFVNIRTDRELKPSKNQLGHIKVTLIQNRIPMTRSVAQIVAMAFLGPPDPPHFDTPIHLNGELDDCVADNLMWRPRWFAIKYHKQFRMDSFHTYRVRLMDRDTQEVYESLKEVCVKNGLYHGDVIKSYVEETYVPLTLQEFRLVD